MPGPTGEADEIMAMSASDALALTASVKAGAPAAVRRAVLYGAWKQIKALTLPARKQVAHFRGVVALLGEVEVVRG